MARRKTDAERGPFGAWAYNTRTLLDHSVEEIVAMLPTAYHPATLRKVEGGSLPGGRPPARMWRELGSLYAKLAGVGHVDIDAQPRLNPESADLDQPANLATALLALAKSNGELAVELGETRKERQALRDQVDKLAATVELLYEQVHGQRETPALTGRAARVVTAE